MTVTGRTIDSDGYNYFLLSCLSSISATISVCCSTKQALGCKTQAVAEKRSENTALYELLLFYHSD